MQSTLNLEETAPRRGGTAIVLTGGGARAAYQVGLLRCLARHAPEATFPIITGVSAGAINAVFLAAHRGNLSEAARDLSSLWEHLRFQDVFRVDVGWLARNFAMWAARLLSGGGVLSPEVRGFVSTDPLRRLLRRSLASNGNGIAGIQQNIDDGRLEAAALLTLNYTTGQTETWVEGLQIQGWERPNRRSRLARLSVEHVMASAALPLIFPAVELSGAWYGDGGIRLAAPLSPALHLGADRILAISTRYARNVDEAEDRVREGYPVPAQIAGSLLNAVFLDAIDRDARMMEQINDLIRLVGPDLRGGLRPVEVLVMRPSVDLGRLAGEYEARLPRAFRYLTRGLGTRQTTSPDFLSLLMFEADYLKRLIEIGEHDAEEQMDAITALLRPRPSPP